MVWARALQWAEDNAKLAELVSLARGNRVPHGAPFEQGQPGGGCGPQCMHACVLVSAFVHALVHICACVYIHTNLFKRRRVEDDVCSSFRCNLCKFVCVLKCKTGCVSVCVPM